jgi:hypothetical protein
MGNSGKSYHPQKVANILNPYFIDKVVELVEKIGIKVVVDHYIK